MTINLQNLKEIENELEAYTLAHGQFSKSDAIRKLYPKLEEALNNGLNVPLLCNYLSQKGLEISPNYLHLVLHRIRKERGINSKKTPTQSSTPTQIQNSALPKPEITPPTNQTSSTDEEVNEYDQMMEEYHLLKNQVDKYVLLGGKREDIENKPISTQRSMVSNLRTQLRHKHKGIY